MLHLPRVHRARGWARAHHVLHWVDGGRSDVDNAALLCQRHHSTVHDRRLWADVQRRPDEMGRYVVWDMHHGSYDRHLERLRRERAVHDPPLTRERLVQLVTAVTVDDVADRRLAQYELDVIAEADYWAQTAREWPWDEEYLATLERAVGEVA